MQGTNNQVKHIYVANTKSNLSVMKDAEGLVYIKGDGFRSDAIDPKTATVKATKAWKLAKVLKKYAVTIAADGDGNVDAKLAGETLIVNIKVRQYIGLSDFETLERSGEVYINGDETATDVATALAKSINDSLKSLATPILEASASGAVVTIKEVEQPWTLGRKTSKSVLFEVSAIQADDNIPVTVTTTSGDARPQYNYDWCSVKESTPVKAAGSVAAGDAVGNGKAIADLEYFYLGERGDIYRNVGYPNVIDSNYQVDATKQYDVIDIHFAFTDTGVNSYRTEKNMVIVGETGAGASAGINKILSDLNTALGTSVAFVG